MTEVIVTYVMMYVVMGLAGGAMRVGVSLVAQRQAPTALPPTPEGRV